MINKINNVGNVNLNSKVNFKSKDKNVSKPVEEKSFDASPLANYSIASIDLKNKLKVTPLIPTIYLPEAVDSIKGERIYKSNGDLYAIIDENEKIRTVFTPVKGRDDMFESIITYDKNTGNIIKEQINEIEDGKHKKIFIHEYSPETSKEIGFTRYDDGKLEFASNNTYNEDGSESHICYDYEEKRYHIFEYSKDGKQEKNVFLTEDMRFITVDSSIKTDNQRIDTREEYFEGFLLNSEKRTSTTMASFINDNLNEIEDLAPQKNMTKEEIQILGESIDGEKTYFSNGKVETVKGKIYDLDVEVRFNPIGKVTNIISEKGEINVDDFSVSETKFVDKDYKITSTEYKFGGSTIYLEKDNKFIEAHYSDKGIISSYFEGEIENDGEKEYSLSLLYDENGKLVNAYNN